MSTRQSPPLAVVTGGTGFIGRHLVDALQAEGWQVRVCGRSPRPADLADTVDYRSADVLDSDSLEPVCAGATHVYHLAGATSSRSSPEQMERVNVEGTERLLQAAERARAQRVVIASTSSVYGKKVPLPQPIREDVDAQPDGGYGESKWLAEQVGWRFADKGLPVSVLRPVTVYGPGAIKLLASTTLDAAIERYAGLEQFVVGGEPVELRMVHIDDVVAALRHLATEEACVGHAFNLSGGYPSSHEVAEVVADELGLELAFDDDPEAGLSYEERAEVRDRMLSEGMRDDILLQRERVRFLKKANPNNRLSIDALRSSGFDLQVTDLPASIRQTVRWYADHRWIL